MTSLLIGGIIAFATTLFGMPLLMKWLASQGIGQTIRHDGPASHISKGGTPTMGGLAIVVGVVLGYGVPHYVTALTFTKGGLLILFAFLATGCVGFADDWIKVKRSRSLGLNKRAKISGQLLVAVLFAYLARTWAKVPLRFGFTRFDSPSIPLPVWLWGILVIGLLIGFSNAVNLTDGLDGLAAGSSIYAFAGYTVIAFWMLRHFDIYRVPQALDVAVMASALVGACAGFLWWNAAPAQIFMGDVGSLAIGAALAAMGVITSTPLLVPVIGGLFLGEAVSVMIQVFTFRLMGGRRVFKMAPIHHHFELKGWPETTVIIRFWIISLGLASIALGIFYADFLSQGGVD